jgi:carbon storage regulator
MLVLSRRPEESIAIGSNITVVVLGIKGNQVRLGFRAPRDVVIDRTEVQHRKRTELVLMEPIPEVETQSP